MDAKTTLALFATAIFFQLSHCVPTHRLVRRAQEFVPYESQSEIASDGQASELQSSVAAREGGTPSSAVPSSYQNYMPSQFNPSQFNPSQLSSQYPSQFPSQFNPSNYASSGAAAPAAAPAGSSGAASEPQPSVAARDGGTPSSAIPSSYQNYMPSQFNPSQLSGQYPSQFPSQFNPSNIASPSAAVPA